MEQVTRIRVSMVCHFSNAEVRSHLPLDNRRFYIFLRKILRMPNVGRGYGDVAPWDSSTISFLKGRKDIDLYVISAHSGLKKRVFSYEGQGVHYSFVSCDSANLLKHLIPSDSLWRKINPMVKIVQRIISQSKPDIVLLVGLENAYYSSTVLGIKGYPIYGLCQTIYNNPERALYGTVDHKNATTEMALFNECYYFGVYCKKHFELLRSLVPDKYIFKYGFPSPGTLLEPEESVKQYDFVNFALGMSEKKGFSDAIEATAIVKQKYPHVLLNLVGGGSEEYKTELKELAERLGIRNNVVFTPFFEKQSDLFLHVQKSRFAVLPCKMDNISGTMTQAMQLGLPIVVYKTTGTPSFNKKNQCALIAEHSDVEDLARNMILLMDDSDLAKQLRVNARQYQKEELAVKKMNGERLIANLKAIIRNYREGSPIPKDQLFNPEKDD